MSELEKKIRTYSQFDFDLERQRVLDYLDYLITNGCGQRRIDATQRRADLFQKIAAERS